MKRTKRAERAMRVDVQLSEALTGMVALSSATPAAWGSNLSSRERIGSHYVSGRTRAWLKTKNPNFERG
jgi:hypothetical protein